MKMIGSHSTAQCWMPSQERPPPEPAGGGTKETLNESLPSLRAKVWVAMSICQPSGRVPPGDARISRKYWRASSQVRSPVSCTPMR